MKTLFLAIESEGTAVLGWSFDDEDEAFECAKSFGYKANEIVELMCPEHMVESDFNSCATVRDYESVIDEQIPELVKLLINNDHNWYVCHKEDGALELKHASSISNIIECGHNCDDYGYTKVEQCWNGVDLSDETYW